MKQKRYARLIYTIFLSFAPMYPIIIIGLVAYPQGWQSVVYTVLLIGTFFVYPVWRMSEML